MHNIPSYQKTAYILIALVLCIALGSAGYIVLQFWSGRTDPSEQGVLDGIVPVADIYQDGSLLMSIPLIRNTDPYTFTVTGEVGGYNEIQVTDGQIGILSASCPDKLCIHQGFQSTSLLPIVCLPNRLVIRVREGEANVSPDIIAY